ncbi:MAG TPA: TVP38/TMEM64 family protein [Patescibacteria group bacterium]|jgi:uncharacterized membrane protein YdjX (TVP38/TMEM64 family)|nr:TVP38/TMEM64 family protein [Patescibacteria group bacterium]
MKHATWHKGVTFAAMAAIAILLFTHLNVRGLFTQILQWIQRTGPWGPVFFVLVYVLATILLVPGSVLSLGAGALFGVLLGSLLVSLGSIAGATCAFLLGRYVARDWVAKKVEGHSRFGAIDRAAAVEGWRIVLLARLSPLFPFTLLNYAFGLTTISLGQYVLGSAIGMIPGTVMYVYFGSLARTGMGDQHRTSVQWALYILGFIATIAIVVIVTRIARRALAK